MDHDNTKQMQINIKVMYFRVGSQPKFFAPEKLHKCSSAHVVYI